MKKPKEKAGVNASEQYVGKLCKKSFLTIWSHQNLFTNRGTSNKIHQGKELCDLLVVFGNYIIIFSIKMCSFPNGADLKKNWHRWYERAIFKSANQLFGAERWIKNFPNRIYTDNLCNVPFPYELPSDKNVRFHRIVVALGASKTVQKFFGRKSSGSLMFNSSLNGDDIYETKKNPTPFTIGHIAKEKGFVHVFDDQVLDIVFSELDTISDFVEYLNAKENFFSSSDKIFCAGEEEFLGFYLQNYFGHETFPPVEVKQAISKNNIAISIAEGLWEEYKLSELLKVREMLRKDSRFLDDIIERFSQHIINETLAYGSDQPFKSNEKNVRFLAAENRSTRAIICHGISQKMKTTPQNHQSSMIFPSSQPRRRLIFLLLPRSHGQNEEDYRSERHDLMTAYALVTKYKFPDCDYISCLATEPGFSGIRRTEDLMTFDFREWKPEDNQNAKQIQKELNILVDVKKRKIFD